MGDDILEFFGRSHASHIHARGRLSTNYLIDLLDIQESEKILEIGFGTGATLIQIAGQYKAELFGYEISPFMYRTALKRIKFCKLFNRINLQLLEKKNQFPVPPNTFDRVYVESIIAIQEGTDFRNLLLEIKRVLKPNGILLFNETIWLDVISKNEAKHINDKCKSSFGIIQSNHEYLHVSDWKKLLIELGFECDLEIRVDDLQVKKEKLNKLTIRSKLFTHFGKTNSLLSLSSRRKWKDFQLKINSIKIEHKKLMEGVIVKARKKE